MAGPTYGWFVEDSTGAVVLQDRWGNVWSIDHVSILSGSFGYDEEGVQKLPRVVRYDAGGDLIADGDRVVIDFLDNNPKLPLVRGGVRSLKAVEFFAARPGAPSADENRLAVRLRPIDAEGNEKGVIELQAGHKVNGEPGGNVELSLTGKLTIVIKRDSGDHTIVIDDDGVKIDAGGTSNVVVNGGTKKVARVDDHVENHTHPAGSLVAGYFTVTGITGATAPKITEGAARFKG